MIPEQGEVIDEIITKIRAGRITRRTFLERAVAVGLSSSVAASLLEACGGTSNSGTGNGQTVNINYIERDTNGVYAGLVKTFNAQNNGVHVTYNSNAPADTGQLLTILTTMLRARAGPLQGCTYNGKLWAAPTRTDAGLIYYRSDINKTPPTTWDSLTTMAKAASPSKAKFGYLWQGAQYEGLVCDFVEVLYGYGGSVLDPSDPKKVTVNSPQGVQALTQMAGWVGTISPSAVTTYKEEDSRSAWQNGDSAFMRNWPYAYSLGNDPKTSKIAGKFDVHPMLFGGSNTTGHSCLGGWQYGINAFSKNPDASWKFIQYQLSSPSQKTIAIQLSLTATLKSIYTDPEVLAKNPFFSKLFPVFQTAQPRPVSPFYPDITIAIQQRVHAALIKQSSPADALSGLQSDLQAIVNK